MSNYDDIITVCLLTRGSNGFCQNQHTRELTNAQKYVTQAKQ